MFITFKLHPRDLGSANLTFIPPMNNSTISDATREINFLVTVVDSNQFVEVFFRFYLFFAYILVFLTLWYLSMKYRRKVYVMKVTPEPVIE